MTLLSLKTLVVGSVIALFGGQAFGQIDTYLNQIHQNGQLNGNVLVIKDGKTVYENSFGYADGSKKIALNKDYRFNVGSVYKEFPAVAIMQLAENKKLALDDKVSKYLPELPEWSKRIAIKNLLQYSSGLPQIAWGNYFGKGLGITDADIMRDLQNMDTLAFEPGTDYIYSNNNPLLLIKIVERITNTSYSEYLENHVLTPAGMKSSVVKKEYPYKDKTLMAMPFDADFKEDMYSISVDGPLFSSTAEDMARWFESLGDFKLISKQSVHVLSETATEGENIQAPLGTCLWENGDITKHAHHGSSGNYECLVTRYKQEGITIVILTNQKQGNVHEITDAIYGMVKSNF